MSFSIVFKTSTARLLDRQPGEKTEQLARRMVQEVLASIGGRDMDPPALRVMNGSLEGQRFEIAEDQAELTIGRSPECDIVLDDQNTSRRQCLSSDRRARPRAHGRSEIRLSRGTPSPRSTRINHIP